MLKNDRIIFWNSRSFIFWIFPLHFLLNFLVCKIKEQEFQNIFCRSLPYFYTYPGAMLLDTASIIIFNAESKSMFCGMNKCWFKWPKIMLQLILLYFKSFFLVLSSLPLCVYFCGQICFLKCLLFLKKKLKRYKKTV